MKKLYSYCLVGLFLAALTVESRAQNTIVRFRISYGTRVFGNIDVELFDQEKPVTVSNFLAYVDSGQYKRTLLHRLIPGFVLQGGAAEVVNPYSFALFQVVNQTIAGPPIVNEFNVGPVRSNLFGTLAMAKVADNPNSATSSWFFNLGDNSANRTNAVENLDQQNGGFTVFGRAIAGTNLFSTFNSMSALKDNKANGIINVADIFYAFSCGTFTYIYRNGNYDFFTDGTDLPVSFLGDFCIRYSDLLVVDIFRLTSSSDTTSPTLTLTQPAASAIVTNDSVVASGTASDDVGVQSIDIILNHERVYSFPGAANWSGTVTNVQPGSNTLTVVSVDANGNESKPVFRSFFQKTQKAIPITIEGQGTVTGLTDGQVVDLGRNYTLVAKPAPGYLFKGWEGTFFIISGDPLEPTLMFYARTNTNIRAVFIANPFIPTKGIYNGIFSESGTAHNDRAGYFTLTLTDRGTFSGKLTIEGRPLPFKGLFQTDGATTFQMARNGSNDLFLRLNLDVTNATSQITGVVSMLSGTWSVPLVADLASYNIKDNAAPQAGLYTLVLPGTSSATEPHGDSHATIKIDGNGKVTITGAMADGGKLTEKTTISKNGNIPLYGNLYAGKGIVIGWLDIVTGNPSTDILGDVAWHKSAAAGGTLYPAGFLILSDAYGSTFVKPATSTTRVLDLPVGTASFTGGNLPSDFANDIAIAENSSVTTSDPNKLTMVFNKGTGAMTGTVAPPGSSLTVKFRGVALQKQKAAAGFFLGPTESGRVSVDGP